MTTLTKFIFLVEAETRGWEFRVYTIRCAGRLKPEAFN
jgi:hypothetical protein